MENFELILATVAVIALLVVGVIFINFFGLWIQARSSGSPVSLLNLIICLLYTSTLPTIYSV